MKEEKKCNNNFSTIRTQMANNKALLQKFSKEVKQNRTDFPAKQPYEWGFNSKQKKIEQKQEIIPNKAIKHTDLNVSKISKPWNYSPMNQKIITKILPSSTYYPPSCSGYDMAYSKYNDTIYIYGGISCSSSISEGIKQYFYKFFEGKWSEIKTQSTYSPTPRYGHTFTVYQKQIILFGGVSQYKQKLKDRCFYTDCSAYSISKNNWRILETSGQNVKTRKNHAAVVYNKFYIVCGGLNQSEETINQICWNNFECKKSFWKSLKIEGRFNHKMIAVEPQNGKDFLCIFGGRNNSSQIVNTMFYIPLSMYEGQLILRDIVNITHSVSPREMPLMVNFMQGFIILGGINKNSDIVEDCWYYNGEKQIIEEVNLMVSYCDLRGAKACLYNDKIYALTGNSTNFKAIQIESVK